MDNITHGLLGVAIGMMRRRDRDYSTSPTDRAVSWACFLAAEAPDLDLFYRRGGALDELAFHRGWTHSLIAAPLIAGIATALVKLFWRDARAGTVYLWSLASVLIAHLLNDYMTGWGTRLLLPFSEARVGLDWIPIVDLLYTLPLALAVLYAWRRPVARRKAARWVLAYLALYTFGYRGLSHAVVQRAVAQKYEGSPVRRIQVSPNMFNPLGWQFVANLGDRYEVGSATLLTPVRISETTAIPQNDQVVDAIRSAPELKPFFDQFAYPVITYRTTPGGYEATLSDIRYRIGGHGMGYTSTLSPGLKVTGVTSGGF